MKQRECNANKWTLQIKIPGEPQAYTKKKWPKGCMFVCESERVSECYCCVSVSISFIISMFLRVYWSTVEYRAFGIEFKTKKKQIGILCMVFGGYLKSVVVVFFSVLLSCAQCTEIAYFTYYIRLRCIFLSFVGNCRRVCGRMCLCARERIWIANIHTTL